MNKTYNTFMKSHKFMNIMMFTMVLRLILPFITFFCSHYQCLQQKKWSQLNSLSCGNINSSNIFWSIRVKYVIHFIHSHHFPDLILFVTLAVLDPAVMLFCSTLAYFTTTRLLVPLLTTLGLTLTILSVYTSCSHQQQNTSF